MPDDKKPLVSIFSLAYNHEAFIEKAIESWLMQKTNFRVEAVIGEDNSTDKTREIVFDYAKKYPDFIRVVTSDSNIGMRANSMRTRLACNGKYIAFCEGDDYWIDPLKLQKQVDIMEANPQYSLCFHDAFILWDDRSRPAELFCPRGTKEVTSSPDVIKDWYIPTASMLMLAEIAKNPPDWFANVYNGDWALQMLLSTKGDIFYIDEPMSVYRKNMGGLSGSAHERKEYIIGKQNELLDYFNDYTNKEFDVHVQAKKASLNQLLKDFKLRKKGAMAYWLRNPGKLMKKYTSR